jgi:hypothetical protein
MVYGVSVPMSKLNLDHFAVHLRVMVTTICGGNDSTKVQRNSEQFAVDVYNTTCKREICRGNLIYGDLMAPKYSCACIFFTAVILVTFFGNNFQRESDFMV